MKRNSALAVFQRKRILVLLGVGLLFSVSVQPQTILFDTGDASGYPY